MYLSLIKIVSKENFEKFTQLIDPINPIIFVLFNESRPWIRMQKRGSITQHVRNKSMMLIFSRKV